METEYIFSSETIESIHKSIKRFVEDNYGEELIFFDRIWEIYETELKRWLNKPLKKYRFKRGKVKHPKFLSISGPSEALDLTTPKIIEIISASLFQVAGLREHVSLKKIGEIIIQTCGKKLSSDFRLNLVKSFAPIMLEDLEKMKLVPEKEVKEELELEHDLTKVEKEPESSSLTEEEKKEYKVYSHEFPQGEPVSSVFFDKIMDEYKKNEEDYLFLIYQKDDGRYYSEGCSTEVGIREIKALKLFLEHPNIEITHKKIYEDCIGGHSLDSPLDSQKLNDVHSVIKLLRKNTNKRKMKFFLETIHGKGYKFHLNDCPEFFLIEKINQ